MISAATKAKEAMIPRSRRNKRRKTPGDNEYYHDEEHEIHIKAVVPRVKKTQSSSVVEEVTNTEHSLKWVYFRRRDVAL